MTKQERKQANRGAWLAKRENKREKARKRGTRERQNWRAMSARWNPEPEED